MGASTAKKGQSNSLELDVDKLHCYGCAHSAARVPFPSRPSGERPCCFCIRNPEREQWAKESKVTDSATIDNLGNPRDFNPFTGNLYNGAPALYNPMDNYVTLDHQDQDHWFNEHPDYRKPIRVLTDGTVEVIEPANG